MVFGQKISWDMGFGQNLGEKMGFAPPPLFFSALFLRICHTKIDAVDATTTLRYYLQVLFSAISYLSTVPNDLFAFKLYHTSNKSC